MAKLEWAAAGRSEVQLRDVAGVLAVGGDEIDQAYLEKWIKALNLERLWHEVAGQKS